MSSSCLSLQLLERAAGVALPQWTKVEKTLSLQKFARGQTVFLQEVEHPYVYVIQQGLVKLAYLDADGEEWIKSFVCEGGFFASMSALRPGGRTTFAAVAMEDALIEKLDHRTLIDLAREHLAWSRALHELTLQFAARKEARERELLTLDAQARYASFCRDHAALLDRVPQKELARHLGVTPVGLNRIAMRLRRENEKTAGRLNRTGGSSSD